MYFVKLHVSYIISDLVCDVGIERVILTWLILPLSVWLRIPPGRGAVRSTSTTTRCGSPLVGPALNDYLHGEK